MTAFRALAFVDTWSLIPSLHERINAFRADDSGARTLPVRWQEDGTWKRAAWTKWPELRATLARIERIGAALLGPSLPVDRGRIAFEMIDPGTTLPWASGEDPEYSRDHIRVHLPVRTNPLAMLYAGAESIHLLPGQLTLVAMSGPHCAVNLGEWPRIHLVADYRARTAEQGEPADG